MTIAFALTHFVKEVQLQHGLRAEDYARYHRYLTRRVATLRQQLNLSNTKKRFLRKDVTASSVSDARPLMLLVLYAERCWAAAEVLQEQARRQGGVGGGRSHNNDHSSNNNKDSASGGGVAPSDQYRKRLNKATKWTSKLCAMATTASAGGALVTPTLQRECIAYDAEVCGRAAVAHGAFARARRAFARARAGYYATAVDLLQRQRATAADGSGGAAATTTTAERGHASDEEALDMLALKLSEMDDRVVYCMQHLGEDASRYAPPSLAAAAAAAAAAATATPVDGRTPTHVSATAVAMTSTTTMVMWHGRVLNVGNIRVRDALREARAVPVDAAVAKLRDASSTAATTSRDNDDNGGGDVGAVLPVGQVNKVVELMDRRIGYYNDALMHARQALRAAAEGTPQQQVEQQLLTHYFLYHVERATAQRALFLADVYSRRFYATERALHSGAPAHARAMAVAATATSMASMAGSRSSRRAELAPTQYASPLEVVRLYEAALEAIEKMQLLPGVAEYADDNDDDDDNRSSQDGSVATCRVSVLHALCRAGKLLYTGEAWRVTGDSGSSDRASSCYRAALAALAETRLDTRQTRALRRQIERAALRMTAERALAASRAQPHDKSSAHTTTADDTLLYLTDAQPAQAAAALNVMRFPPDYQTVACKPVFLDIASTYVRHVPPSPTTAATATTTTTTTTAEERAHSKAARPTTATTTHEGEDKTTERRWRWRWGWGGGGGDGNN